MFKIGSFEQELMEEMSKHLVANQAEKTYSFNKLAKAADYLNNAAELFDDVGMFTESENITKMLEKLGAEQDLEDPSFTEPSASEEVENTNEVDATSLIYHMIDNMKSPEAKKIKDFLINFEKSKLTVEDVVSKINKTHGFSDMSEANDSKKMQKSLKETGTPFGRELYKADDDFED